MRTKFRLRLASVGAVVVAALASESGSRVPASGVKGEACAGGAKARPQCTANRKCVVRWTIGRNGRPIFDCVREADPLRSD